ncbi:MAG: DUF1566 domain-containing protein [bacterium]
MMRINRVNLAQAVAALCACLSFAVHAQGLAIQSFSGTGQLTFNEMSTAVVYRVEWAPTPAGPWTNFTGAAGAWLDAIPATGSGIVTCSVPMCYRVVATVTNPVPAQCYTDNGDGTVTDTCTGLMWTKRPLGGDMTWDAAVAFCDNLVTNGYSDWRLPSVSQEDGPGGPLGNPELDTLGRPGGIPGAQPYTVPAPPFTNFFGTYYWSVTSFNYNQGYAWCVHMGDGTLNYLYKADKIANVWPVRGGP